MQKESIIALFEDAQAAPFAKDSWQHAVDNQLVAFGRTSQEFVNPHEAMAWLAEMHMELGVSNAGAAQAVRMLTPQELEHCRLWNDGPINQQLGVLRKFCEVNDLIITPSGEIGDLV